MAHFAFQKHKKTKQQELEAEAEKSTSATSISSDSDAETEGANEDGASKKGGSSPLQDSIDQGVKKLSKQISSAVDRMNGTGKAAYSVWSRGSKRVVMYIIVAVILLGYVFFFTSQLWVKDKVSANDPTPVGEAQTFGTDGDKSFTIDTWHYSPSQSLMELKFNVSNNAFDGKDSYDFTVGYQNAKGLTDPKCVQMVKDPDYVVLIIRNVPEEWTSIQVSLYYAGHVEGDPLLNFYASNDSIAKYSHIKILSSNGYRAELVDEQIAGLQKQKVSLQKKIDQNNQKIQNMNKTMQEINSRMALDTTDEQDTDKDKLNEIKTEQANLKASNDGFEAQIGGINKDISQLEKKRDAYLGKSDISKDKSKASDKKKDKNKSDKSKGKDATADSDVAVKVKKTSKDSSADASSKSKKDSGKKEKKTTKKSLDQKSATTKKSSKK